MPAVHSDKESATYVCNNVFTVYPVPRPFREGQVGLFAVIIGLVFILTSFIILFWIKRQERLAQYGDHLAVKSVIFPVFVKVLYINAVASFYRRGTTGPTP